MSRLDMAQEYRTGTNNNFPPIFQNSEQLKKTMIQKSEVNEHEASP